MLKHLVTVSFVKVAQYQQRERKKGKKLSVSAIHALLLSLQVLPKAVEGLAGLAHCEKKERNLLLLFEKCMEKTNIWNVSVIRALPLTNW